MSEIHIEADSVVGDCQYESMRITAQLHRHVIGSAVPDGVVRRLLNDAKETDRDLGGQHRWDAVMRERDVEVRPRELAGKTASSARARVVELLRASGDLDGEPRPVTRPVKFYERGDKPLEIVTSGQWYIRNGGRDARIRSELLERGRELTWPFGRS